MTIYTNTLQSDLFDTQQGRRTLKKCMLTDVFENRAVYEIMWRPQKTIWLMRKAYWMPEATKTHSQYVTLIAFPPGAYLGLGRLGSCLGR